MPKSHTPGVPKLLRVLNDQAALKLLLDDGPQTRAQLAERTSMSKVTASQMMERLQTRGLVEVIGSKSGGRGPNASLYAAVPTFTYVVGIEVGLTSAKGACADFTGHIVGRAEIPVEGSTDPVSVVRRVVTDSVADAGIEMSKVERVVLGTPGVIDPGSGDIGFSWNLPAWHRGLRTALNEQFGAEVAIENDVNLATIAEQRSGGAGGASDFVYAWYGGGLGLGVMLNGRLYRGATGAAGEIGFLPVPGGELPTGGVVTRLSKGSYQRVIGGDAVIDIGAKHGFPGAEPEDVVRAAIEAGEEGAACLDEIGKAMALGIVAVCVLLDPTVVVLGGPVGYAGGLVLAGRVAAHTTQLAPVNPSVVPGTVIEEPVMRGAILHGLDAVREGLFA
ncbi:ROK family transcriptional regulator [Glycomyces buryatensis]|uniref:ROK family transcriptional regulator n=1 Tax=Glycomyces buryatensis TaxID=2570927 RepID=A0A4S8Q369_9ACTN|nr:ROK family transcriptional regulator [Glycomyces buryatensis]THV34614.1 ROK family transcriptional regulator [Glycomyces buryatensis]